MKKKLVYTLMSILFIVAICIYNYNSTQRLKKSIEKLEYYTDLQDCIYHK
jgi:hypothetical protein